MIITVRLFAMLREQAGVGTVELDVDDAVTAGEAALAAAEHTGIAAMVRDLRPALAVNRQYADADTPLVAGDELALIPPVSGGAPARTLAELTDRPLSLDRLVDFVRDPGAGAIVTFSGEPRDIPALEYEAYVEMAQARLEVILRDLAEEYRLIAIAAAHRLGTVPSGESCVIVATSAAHRPEAFAAARDAIDRLKQDVPIWKRERAGARAQWVVPAPAEAPAT